MATIRYLDTHRACKCPLCADHWSNRTMSPHWRAVSRPRETPLRLTRRGWCVATVLSVVPWVLTVWLGNAIAQVGR